MKLIETLLRMIRFLLGTVTVVALFGLGGAVAATRFAQADLEDRAVASARRLAISTIEPVLQPHDAEHPLRGARYASVLAVVRRDVLPGPISGVKIWSHDGTILFADERSLVGETRSEMERTIASIGRASAIGEVEDDRFLALVPLEVAKGASVTAELARPHDAIVEGSKQRWWAWVGTAGRIAAVAFALYLLLGGLGAVLAAQRRRAARRAWEARPLPGAATTPRPKTEGGGIALLRRLKAHRAAGGRSGEGPGYLQPGFRDVEESRRKAEQALAASLQERALLEDRVRRLEGELAAERGRPPVADAR